MKMKNNTSGKGKNARPPLFCACMVSKRKFYSTGAAGVRSMANAVFQNSRRCPYCRLKGRGEWGEFTSEDRKYYNVETVYLSRLKVFAFAIRQAISTFVDTLKTIELIEQSVKRD